MDDVELYSVRNGLRKQTGPVKDISVEVYAVLFVCCKKYFKNLTHLFPLQYHNAFVDKHYTEFDEKGFDNRLKIKIPTLYRDHWGLLTSPDEGIDYDQYALFDLIEFIAQNALDLSEGWNNERYKNFRDIKCLDTGEVVNVFRKEINAIFEEAGLLFTLTRDKCVERIPEFSTLTPEIQSAIEVVAEIGLRDLLIDACHYHRDPKPDSRKLAVEKLWDALERLKTYYTTLDKKASATKIIDEMSDGQPEFKQVFEDEFMLLTKIGNNYRIRHHETDKIEIKDIVHYDYFFNRCLALISTAIQYLK